MLERTRPNRAIHPPSPVLVTLDNVSKQVISPAGTLAILTDIRLTIAAGEFVGVIGPSGSGKSTLINMITGIDHPTQGNIVVAGQPIHRLSEDRLAQFRGRNIGVVFQFFQLLPTLTALENVLLPMNLCQVWRRAERHSRAMRLLEMVRMDAHAQKFPSMLSGGQQQRVAIARALANDPPLIVGDEPTGNLDRESAALVFELLKGLVRAGKTVVIVTHDAGLARVIPRVIEVRDGRIYDHGNRPGIWLT
jgi:putative ABC transport system ATP-binding protein